MEFASENVEPIGFPEDINCTMVSTSAGIANDTSMYIYNHTILDDGVFEQTIHYLNQIGIPLVVLFGCFGNTLSLVVFLHTHLRYQSASVYLAFLNVVDTGFLLSLFITWFSWLEIRLFHKQVLCQLVLYSTFVFAFLSVWTVVAFTVERFIVVFHPLKRQRLCTRKKAKIVLISLTVFAMTFYSFPLWCAEVISDHRGSKCTFKHQYYMFLMIMTFMDTVITLVIPSLAIVILNGGISYKLCYFFSDSYSESNNVGEPIASSSSGNANEVNLLLNRRWPTTGVPQTGSASSKRADNNRPAPIDDESDSQEIVAIDALHQPSRDVPNNKLSLSRLSSRSIRRSERSFADQYSQQHLRMRQLRTTRTLLIVSSVFLILNLPCHTFRAYHVVVGMINPERDVSGPFTYLWQQLLQLVYYVNFAVNFVLYVACSRSFRGAFHRLRRRVTTSIRRKSNDIRIFLND